MRPIVSRCWGPAILAAAIAAPACGGNGPGVEGVEAAALFERYTGAWVLDTLASDASPTPAPLGRGRGGRGGDTPFGGAGGRAGRGLPPGGASPAGRGGPSGRSGGPGGANIEAMRATMELARIRPERLELELTDSLFTIAEGVADPLELPMQGDEVDTVLAGAAVKVRVRWDDRMPRVERAVAEGGTVIDRYEVVAADRLVVTRTVDGAPQGGMEVRFAYDREDPR